MSKIVISGCSCCLKSSVGKRLASELNSIFIGSDSDVISNMVDNNLIDYTFKPRLNLKYYQIKQLTDDYNWIVERSLLDQLIFAEITNIGWFELDKPLDEYEVLTDSLKWIELERSLNIDKYILLVNTNETFINDIISDPNFINSKRSNSFYSISDYFELQSRFITYYEHLIERIKPKQSIKVYSLESGSAEDMINNYITKLKKIL